MPRNKELELCMMCGLSPCICTPAKRRRGRSVVTGPSVDAVTPSDSPFAGPRIDSRASASPDGGRVSATESSAAESILRPVEELVEEEALRALAPLMHPTELERYQLVLSSTLTPRERAAVWKYRKDRQCQQ